MLQTLFIEIGTFWSFFFLGLGTALTIDGIWKKNYGEAFLMVNISYLAVTMNLQDVMNAHHQWTVMSAVATTLLTGIGFTFVAIDCEWGRKKDSSE